jgi:LysM repeat protein
MQSSRSTTGARRLGVLVGPALIGAVVLSSCGGGESGATQSTIDLSAASTAFVVRPPATTLPPTDTLAEGDPDAIVEGIQEYTVQSGDAPYVLVTRFGISLEDLLGVNEWTDPSQFPFPGTVILIPPGAKSVTAAAATDSAETSTDTATETETTETEATETEATPTETIPDAGDNCSQGTYTIVEGDYEGLVAGKFDVTVDALRAANVSTPGYSAFYPGLEIVIPAKSDC